MRILKTISLAFALVAATSVTFAQTTYKYSVNLNEVKDDQLVVTLVTPKVTKEKITFYMPKIVPGTYRNSDFGKFVSGLKAFDKTGKQLPVEQSTENSWNISKATTLAKIVYNVQDTYDTTIPNEVYSMAGTNFEAGKNFVFNTCGLFGYLDNMKDMNFELQVVKPDGFYGSTGVVPVSTTNTLDTYKYDNADHFYDSPLMFCKPDTTTMTVGGANILVSVYSPNKLVTSAYIARNLKTLLAATNKYLGGKLPVNKYAFIYYFSTDPKIAANGGAWEHSYSSFYSLPEGPQEESIAGIVDMSAHEFFHIVTPLTISSREVKKFDFNTPKMSKHLWLYEGSTEYDAHHMQVQYGINTPEQWLGKLSEKITYSRQAMNDTLSFTEMSKGSAGKYKDEYNNVYMKGALISACLDLYLLKLSNGKYGLANLKHDLGAKYGKDKFFEDDVLFDEITKMTYPEIRTFFSKYVEGTTPIPYEQFFGYAGIKFTPVSEIMAPTMGDFAPALSPEGVIYVKDASNLNDFGKAIGFKTDDELLALNGQRITLANVNEVFTNFAKNTKQGDKIEFILGRKDASGVKKEIVTSAPAVFTKRNEFNKLTLLFNATPEQMEIRKIWFGAGNL